MARNLLLIPMRVHGSSTHSVRKSAHAMALADAIDRGIRGLDVVIALEIPGNADRPHVIRPSKVQDLFDDLIGRLVRVIVRATLPALQTLIAELAISVSPFIERTPRDPEVPASLVDVSDLLRVLENPLLSMNFSLISGHLDLLGHHLGR
jgi:hypothetical protein